MDSSVPGLDQGRDRRECNLDPSIYSNANLQGDHECEYLVQACLGDGIDCEKRVHHSKCILSNCFIAREVCDLREDKAEACELCDATVNELGLTENFQRSIAFVTKPPCARCILGEAKWIKPDVADQLASEVSRRPWQCGRWHLAYATGCRSPCWSRWLFLLLTERAESIAGCERT